MKRMLTRRPPESHCNATLTIDNVASIRRHEYLTMDKKNASKYCRVKVKTKVFLSFTVLDSKNQLCPIFILIIKFSNISTIEEGNNALLISIEY